MRRGPRWSFDDLEPRRCRARVATIAVHIHDESGTPPAAESAAFAAEAVAATPASDAAAVAEAAGASSSRAKVRAASVDATTRVRVRVSTSADESPPSASSATAASSAHAHDAALLLILRDDSVFSLLRGARGHSAGGASHDAGGRDASGEMPPGMAGHVPQAMSAPGMLSTAGYHGRREMEVSEDLDIEVEARPAAVEGPLPLEPRLEPDLEPELEPRLEPGPATPEGEGHEEASAGDRDAAVRLAAVVVDGGVDGDVDADVDVEPPGWLGRLAEGLRRLLRWVWAS